MMANARIFGVPAWLVFWILFAVLVVPSGVFLFQSFGKLDEILESVSSRPELETDRLLNLPSQKDDSLQKRASVALERDVVVFRQHRASAALATRTWMRFMSLIFGAILVVIGSAFTLGRISTPDQSSGEFTFGDIKGSLATSSPGLVLVVIGGMLIAIPHFSGQEITTNDVPAYISKSFSASRAVAPDNPSSTPEAKAELDEIRRRHNLPETGGIER